MKKYLRFGVLSSALLLLLFSAAHLAKRYTSMQNERGDSVVYIFNNGKPVAVEFLSPASKIEIVNPSKLQVAHGQNGWLGSIGPQASCTKISLAETSSSSDDPKPPFVYWVKGSSIKTAHLPKGISIVRCDSPLPVSLFNEIESPLQKSVQIGSADSL